MPAIRRRGHVALLSAFTAATFTGAALVFLIQPMAAKMLLPLFGGSPSVWVTSMVFFQASLLAGYAFAHLSTSLLEPRKQRFLQIGILVAAALALPIGRHLSSPPAGATPELWVVAVLALSIGAPFLVVATGSPVLQRWFAATSHSAARDPYFLYAAGNAGSLLALLAYPFLVEPHLSLTRQADLWSGSYFVFMALLTGCSFAVTRQPVATPVHPHPQAAEAPTWSQRLRWVFMAFVPSSLMLGVSSHITTNIAAVPLLWFAPLAVYLLTFILAFARRRPISVTAASRMLPFVATLVVLTLLRVIQPPLLGLLALHLALLFVVGLLVHGRLADERPRPERLTEFYLLLSVGGVLGGAFNGLLAPVVFDRLVEYPLVLVLALFLRPAPQTRDRGGPLRPRVLDVLLPTVLWAAMIVAVRSAGASFVGLVLGLTTIALILFARRPRRFALGAAFVLMVTLAQTGGLYQERTFFGVLRVTVDSHGGHVLYHGTTLHGIQDLSPGHASHPLSYFSTAGPIGDVFDKLQARRRFHRVSIIGLGVGSLAAYGRPGQQFTFYEIDPAVVRIASNPRLFTFLAKSRADVRTVVGDGRRSIAKAPPHSNDLIVIDAFSSDAIPVHLLTREAVELYFEKLRPGGVIAFHITNWYLDLSRVLSAVARDLNVAGVELYRPVSSKARERGVLPSRWVVLARNAAVLEPLKRSGWRRLTVAHGSVLWTDEFSNLLSVLRH